MSFMLVGDFKVERNAADSPLPLSHFHNRTCVCRSMLSLDQSNCVAPEINRLIVISQFDITKALCIAHAVAKTKMVDGQ